MALFLVPLASAATKFVAGLGIRKAVTYLGTTALGFFAGNGVSSLANIVRWSAVLMVAYIVYSKFIK